MRLWFALLALSAVGSAQPAQSVYAPPGMWAWDPWFAKDGDIYHAFYLEAPSCLPDETMMHMHSSVGHSVSSDLVHWRDEGPAVTAVRGTWNNRNVATGSVGRGQDTWWMVYTGYAESGPNQGIGLAASQDLSKWKKVGDGPIVPFTRVFRSEWKGKTVDWQALADPFLYPEKVYGYHYIFVNAYCGDPARVSVNERGCIGLLRSADMINWDPAGIVALPEWFDRMEIPQVWQRNGHWYLAFASGLPLHSDKFRGSAPAAALAAENFVFMADRFEGPYAPVGKWWLTLPDGLQFFLGKVVTAGDRDMLMPVMFFGGPRIGLAEPYPIDYLEDGSLRVVDREAPSINRLRR